MRKLTSFDSMHVHTLEQEREGYTGCNIRSGWDRARAVGSGPQTKNGRSSHGFE